MFVGVCLRMFDEASHKVLLLFLFQYTFSYWVPVIQWFGKLFGMCKLMFWADKQWLYRVHEPEYW